VPVSIGHNFTGISYGSSNTNSASLPPDCNGAVGPNHFVEFINGVFAVYNKTNGDLVDFKTDVDFWAGAKVGIDATWEVSDPRVIYDPTSQRWFASQVDIDVFTQLFDNTFGTNHYLLAVSATSDPTGQWKGVSFDTDPDHGSFADFPTLGVDGQGVYLAGDMYDALDDPTDPTVADIGQGLVAIPKADLLVAATNISHRTWFGIMSNSQRGQVLQPASCADGTCIGSVLAAGDIGTTSDPHSNLVTYAVQDVTNAAGATLSPATFITVSLYVVPFNDAVGFPLLTATQPDGTSALQANDARFSARVYAVGGVLYAVHNTELNGHIAIRWYRIRAADGVVLESGTIADPNSDFFFPSIAANPIGTVVIGYNGSSLITNLSGYAIAGQTVKGVTTFGNPLLLKSGVTSYHGDDEDPTGMFGAPVSRWGDYSATSVDPTDPNRFWTMQMFPSDTNVWSTQITELVTTPLVSLAIEAAGTNVTVSWSSGFAGYHLQSATNLAPPIAWLDVAHVRQTNDNQVSVLLPASAGSQFFRLKQ
jgi:hypothetical protein